jgi:hypothetical protein
MDDRPSGGREAPEDRTRRTGRLVRRPPLSRGFMVRGALGPPPIRRSAHDRVDGGSRRSSESSARCPAVPARGPAQPAASSHPLRTSQSPRCADCPTLDGPCLGGHLGGARRRGNAAVVVLLEHTRDLVRLDTPLAVVALTVTATATPSAPPAEVVTSAIRAPGLPASTRGRRPREPRRAEDPLACEHPRTAPAGADR